MQSNKKFLKIAKRIAKEDKELFDSLIEFEKTKKIRSKTRLDFTVDRNLAVKFRKFCKEKGFNMSAIIEKAIRKEIESK